MAKEEQKPDKEEKPAVEVPKDTPVAPLSDEDVEKLFANIGEEAEKADPPDPDNEGEPEKPKVDSPPAAFDPAVLQTPEGQKAITEAVNQAIATKSAGAETDAKRKELQELIDSGNHEELGKRWQQEMESAQHGQTAVDSFLTTFYREMFSNPLFQNLTAEERKDIEPDGRFPTDAAYVAHLAKFMAAKEKTSMSNEDFNIKVAERVEAQKRNAAGKKAVKGSVQGATPAESAATPAPTTARDLVSAGLREAFPKAYAEQG